MIYPTYNHRKRKILPPCYHKETGDFASAQNFHLLSFYIFWIFSIIFSNRIFIYCKVVSSTSDKLTIFPIEAGNRRLLHQNYNKRTTALLKINHFMRVWDHHTKQWNDSGAALLRIAVVDWYSVLHQH